MQEWPSLPTTTNGHRHDGEVIPSEPWQRMPLETAPSWNAFECYRCLGPQRSLSKAAAALNRSQRVLERWCSRHDWVRRAAAWDEHLSKTVNARLIDGITEMRQRLVDCGTDLQAKAAQRLLNMTPQEIAQLSPYETAAWLKTGADLEAKGRTGELENGLDPRFPTNTPPIPKFEICIIRPGTDSEGRPMVGVQLNDGRYGYIPRDHVEEARRDHPEWTFLV